jgi:hypothetical protein
VNLDQARQIVALLVAAYPQSPADEITVDLWVNALVTAEFDIAAEAVQDVVRTTAWWPSIAEFNGRMTSILRERARRAQPTAITSRIRCDGTGWFDRGSGLEPCPTCNPWLRAQFEEGDLHAVHRPTAPKDYVMPAPCRPHHEGTPVAHHHGARIALAAYLDACAEQGRPPTKSIVAAFERGDIPGMAVGQ